MACVYDVLDVLLGISEEYDKRSLQVDCPLHLVSTALFVLTLPFFRGDSEQKLLNFWELWSFEPIAAVRIFSYLKNCICQKFLVVFFFFLHLVQRSRTALGTGKTTQFLLLSKAANSFIRVPPIVTKAKNYLLWVLNQESLFFLLFGFFLKPFGFNGEHAYKIKGGKFGACISHHRWLHSGVMSLSQLYTAFVSRGSESLPSSIGGV